MAKFKITNTSKTPFGYYLDPLAKGVKFLDPDKSMIVDAEFNSRKDVVALVKSRSLKSEKLVEPTKKDK